MFLYRHLLKIYVLAATAVSTLISEVNVLTVNCVYTKTQYVDEDRGNNYVLTPILYSCLNLNIEADTKSSEVVEAVSQNHLSGKTDEDVELFMKKDPKKMMFPKGIGKFFPNLTGITFINADLERITSDSLKFLPKLKFLLLAQNQLTVLPSDLFKYTTNLEYLHVGKNLITSFGHNILKPIPKLKRLYIYDNVCMNEGRWTIQPKEIKELQKLMNEQCPPDEIIDGTVEVSTKMLLI